MVLLRWILRVDTTATTEAAAAAVRPQVTHNDALGWAEEQPRSAANGTSPGPCTAFLVAAVPGTSKGLAGIKKVIEAILQRCQQGFT